MYYTGGKKPGTKGYKPHGSTYKAFLQKIQGQKSKECFPGEGKDYKVCRENFRSNRNTLYLNHGDGYMLCIHLSNSYNQTPQKGAYVNHISIKLKESTIQVLAL